MNIKYNCYSGLKAPSTDVLALSEQDSGTSTWKKCSSFRHTSSSLGAAGSSKARGSFLYKKPSCSSGGPSGQFVCRGADGKGGLTTVLKTGSHQQGMKVGAPRSLTCLHAFTMPPALQVLQLSCMKSKGSWATDDLGDHSVGGLF